MKKLTIGMCVYDDFDGVFFTVQSLRMYHDVSDIEIIVVDNNPDSDQGKATSRFIEKIPESKYIAYREKNGTSVRNEIFNQALGEYTLCLDCHVMLVPGAIDSLLEYYDNNPNSLDIIQGPLVMDNLKYGLSYTHFKPSWGGSMYGQWDRDVIGLSNNVPFEIPMQGLGLFSCVTKNWLGFNKDFRGFGGEEGYIHEKFRQNGGRAMCIPQLKWLHRFERPGGVPYPNTLSDRAWNYFIGWLELKKDTEHEMIKQIYREFSKNYAGTDKVFEEAKQWFNKTLA